MFSTRWKLMTAGPLPGRIDLAGQAVDVRRLLRALGQRLWAWLVALGRVLAVLVLVVGMGTIYEEAIGDGPLPRLSTLQQSAQVVERNTTAMLPVATSPEARWQALAPTRSLLKALSPEMALWLIHLHREGRLVYGEPADVGQYDVSSEARLTAAYRHWGGKLYLAPAFWELPDGEKLATLAHEYRHARQNLPKRISCQLARLLGGRFFEYGSALEAEAFAYERAVQDALGG